MTRCVLDVSVAIKWAIPSANEPLTAEALSWLDRYKDGRVDFAVPDIFWAEFGNVLWKGERQKRWDRAHAESAGEDMQARDFATFSSRELLPAALRIAFTHDRSTYDCLYLALAIETKSELLTADERLANAVAAHLPVRWLGAF